MNNQRTTFLFLTLIVLAAATLVGLTWANISYADQNPGNNEFVSRYVGTRKFLLEGVSPYSEVTTAEIQRMVNGRAETTNEDQLGFLYPLYSVYLFAPFALIANYALARAVWMTLLEISLVLLMVASLSLSRWKVSPWMTGVLLIFTLFWVYSFHPVLNGDISILLALFMTLSLLAIRAENDGLAGFLLALTAVKPQVMLLLAIFVLLWSAIKGRWRIFNGFISTLAFMIVTAMMIIPDWVMQFLRQLVETYENSTITTSGSILKEALPGVGSQLGWAFTIVMVTVLIVEWRAALNKEFYWFYWAALITLVATTMIGMPASRNNFILLYPTVILVFSAWAQQWKNFGKWLVALSMLFLFFGLWWWEMPSPGAIEQNPQNPTIFFILPLFLFVTLYWVRWWVLRPARPLLEHYRSQ